MYDFPSLKLSSGTSPPCFWNCETEAGDVLKIRQGALPAVIAAPMTSSELLPVGISCAVIFWSACSAFQAATICLPQATSSALFGYQIVTGPRALAASAASPEPPPPPQAASEPTSTTVSNPACNFMIKLQGV